MNAQMGGEAGGPEELIQAGAVTFGLEYRTPTEGAKEGSGQRAIKLRLLPGGAPLPLPERHREEERTLYVDVTDAGDPRAWTLDKIRNRLQIILIRCETEDIAGSIDQRNIDGGLPNIVAWAETKTHNRDKTAFYADGYG